MTSPGDTRDPRGYDLDEERRRYAEEMSRSVLMGTNLWMRRGRRLFHTMPGSSRCKLCASPLRGGFAPVMSAIGKGPWSKNPKYCSMCFKDMVKHRSGAEIPCSLLFADVRGSTELGEEMSPTDFRGLMDRFFSVATDVLIEHDAIVDKFVGDEVIALFIPVLTGELHASRAVAAGRALLAATGHVAGGHEAGGVAPWISIGAGVNTGVAFVGALGPDDHVEFTAMGDPVNVAARLADAAGPGELLVSVAAAQAAALDEDGLERRQLALKGKREPTDVVVLGAS
jgi:adenylate cyclase